MSMGCSQATLRSLRVWGFWPRNSNAKGTPHFSDRAMLMPNTPIAIVDSKVLSESCSERWGVSESENPIQPCHRTLTSRDVADRLHPAALSGAWQPDIESDAGMTKS